MSPRVPKPRCPEAKHLLGKSIPMSPGIDSARRRPCPEICRHFCQRFGGALLLPGGEFEIPFLEKNVPSDRQRVSGRGDSTLVEFSLDAARNTPVGRRRKGLRSLSSLKVAGGLCLSFTVALPPCVFPLVPFLFGSSEGTFEEMGRTPLFNHLVGEHPHEASLWGRTWLGKGASCS